MKRYLFLAGLLLCTTLCSAQYLLKKANKLYDEMAYTAAAEAYEDYYEKENPPGSIKLKIADTYYYINRYSDAVVWFEKYKADKLDDAHFNRYIQSLRVLQQYDKADEQMTLRLQKMKNQAPFEKFITEKQRLDSVKLTESPYTVSALDVNSNKSDFGAAFYRDKIIFSSARDTAHLGGKVYKWNEQPFLGLYVADRDTATGALLNPEKFMRKSQTRYHNATVAFTADGKSVYYSTNTTKKYDRLNNAANGTNNLRINKAMVSGDELVNDMVLPFSSIKHSVSHPALSTNGKWLFFTGDMRTGEGETDLYVVSINENGTYGNPVNLGDVINTPGKEMFPFVTDEVLYFASDGHYGFGGLDIFESKITETEDGLLFGNPVNLGAPVNSNRDDFAYILSLDGTYGYFSSNRDGGKGDDDIYYFTRKEVVCQQLVEGTVSDITTSEPIAEATVIIKDKNGKQLYKLTTDANGYYSANAECDTYLIIEATKEGYNKDMKEVTTPPEPGSVRADLALTNYEDLIIRVDDVEKIKINPIYFDFNKYDITPQGAQELDKVLYVLVNFPHIDIKIESHTDSRGGDAYNMELSQNRATSTYNYILSKGIDPARIESVKGYGETRLLNKCSNGVKCTEEEHQLNRRSDFIVVNK